MSLSKLLRESAKRYWNIRDIDMSLSDKKRILELADNCDWGYNQALLDLMEVRAGIDRAIAFLIEQNEVSALTSSELSIRLKKLVEMMENATPVTAPLPQPQNRPKLCQQADAV